jgi:hypothetical protein
LDINTKGEHLVSVIQVNSNCQSDRGKRQIMINQFLSMHLCRSSNYRGPGKKKDLNTTRTRSGQHRFWLSTFGNGLFLFGAMGIFLSGCATSQPSAALRLNQIQVIGTHNSYHQRAPDALRALVAKRSPAEALSLDYGHLPLPDQFSLGIRQIELDCFADPHGGLYSAPKGPKWAEAAGLGKVPEYDPEGRLKQPGFKVMHVQDVDYWSSALTFVEALQQVREWSLKHPRHLPIFILIEPKDDRPVPEMTEPIPFDEKQLAALEVEIRSVIPREKILAPDDVRGREISLPEALRKHGWPQLDSVRGKVMFGLDNEGALRDAYLREHPALEHRLLFVSVPPTNPAAAWMKENDAVDGFARIQQLVKSGFLVRTRADADTVQARKNETNRREMAFASGAQFISTDYPVPDPKFSSYSVHFAGDTMARVNPVNSVPITKHSHAAKPPPLE